MTSQRRRSPAGIRVLLARAAALAACGLLAAACGSTVAPTASTASNGGTNAGTQSLSPSPAATPSASPASSSPAGTGTPGTGSAAEVDLSVTLSGSTQHWTLRCAPPGGNVPDPQAACQRLLGNQTIFIPSPHHVMCPQMMGDGPSFLVSGTFLGAHVHRAIVDGGCDMAKWSILHAIFE